MNAKAAVVSAQPADYVSEVRFGVVMYGGVSLAIYINGVASEMYEMACATPKPGALLDERKAAGTREIYRRLAWLLANPELREAYARRIAERDLAQPDDGQPPADVWDPAPLSDLQATRLTVDVIAGTSAGGINGVFLGKALANGEQFAPLKDLWVKEGDFGLLLNDKRSYEGLGFGVRDRSGEPDSLLNSDRMYVKLHDAMQSMKSMTAIAPAAGESPLVDELDLFVTTTDILGSAVPLRLFDKVVYERRYKQNYQFSYPDGVSEGGNDFAPANNAFLAFAARCTSSFPFAFEPMTLDSLTRLRLVRSDADLRLWDRFFPGLPKKEVEEGNHVRRAFGDGGYLDNKPFTYVVEALSTRQAEIPMERKLIYVEPSPEHVDPDSAPQKDELPPDALSNSLAALTSIPRYEAIRDDLQAVLRRNRRIERVERIVRLGEADLEAQETPFAGVQKEQDRIAPWSQLKLSQMVKFYGTAFLPYRRLRVYTVTDRLANRLAELWGVDRASDDLYALRALVRVWRDSHFQEEANPDDPQETVNAFLDQFDLDYRLRRVGFLLRKADQMTRLLRRRRMGLLKNVEVSVLDPSGLSDSDVQVVRALKAKNYDLFGERADAASLDRALAALREFKAGTLQVRDALRQVDRHGRNKAATSDLLSDELRSQLNQVLALLLGNRPEGAPPLLLTTVSGGSVRVELPLDWLKASSASRTLQESVLMRAQALFRSASDAERTKLQDAIESCVTAMRVKRSERRPQEGPDPETNRISRAGWELIGRPQLVLDDSQPTMKIGDTGREALDTAEGRLLRSILGEYFLRFDSFDQMSFPLYYDTGAGEPSTVEIVRVSPEDAPSLIDETRKSEKRRKLAGTALFNFGAFLDGRWRLNDIMWGRLDGAERLIHALLPAADAATTTVRKELIEHAHRIILREELVATGHDHLADLLVKALAEAGGGNTPQQLRELLDSLKLGDSQQRARLAAILASLLNEQGLLDYVRHKRDVEREPDPKASLESAARAVTITGRMLERISDRQGRKSAALRWLARSGLLLQGLLAVSLPGSLKSRWWSHGLKVLYAFELVVLAFALLFGDVAQRTFALTALGVTATVHLLSLVAGDLMRSKSGWFKLVIAGAGVAIVSMAAVGTLGVRNLGWQPLICGEPAADKKDSTQAGWFCGKGKRTE